MNVPDERGLKQTVADGVEVGFEGGGEMNIETQRTLHLTIEHVEAR